MITAELTREQREAVEAPFDGCFAIVGAAGTGKSRALAERIARAKESHPQAQPLVVGSYRELGALAVEILRETGRDVALIDDADAELLFTGACAPLFEMQWEELGHDRLDPEVPGLRSPERFLQSAFRLIRRLGDANVDPQRFLSLALRGAADFYAKPPNFSDQSLLLGTKNEHHGSLAVDARELQRQYRREIDLAKILAHLYEDYVRLVRDGGAMTGRDAIGEATACLRDDAALARRLRERYGLAFVDDAQELTEGDLSLLRAIFGDELAGVTLCGDPASTLSMVRRTQPEATFAMATSRVELRDEQRRPRVDGHRLSTAKDEAASVAEQAGEWIASGVPAERIGVLFRSTRNVEVYEAAMLERDIPVLVSGDLNVFADRRALDAIALLWNVHDPFRHEWLLRTLSGGALGLSDASLVTLCGEPADPQRPLFTFDEEPAPTVRSSRWNPKRDLRLGWNVIRGERDEALGEDARARVQRFRRLREGWLEAMHALPFEAFARKAWSEGLARDGEPGSARAGAQQFALRRLLDRLEAFVRERPGAGVADVLEYAERRMNSDLETCELDVQEGFVQMTSVEAARGREFDRAIVANVRPGAFPLWYVPDGFLFSPKYGMIPRENAGDARASRTAKFSYYVFASNVKRKYNDRERRAFAYALRRARDSVLVTAWGTPTSGKSAPELLEEIRRR